MGGTSNLHGTRQSSKKIKFIGMLVAKSSGARCKADVRKDIKAFSELYPGIVNSWQTRGKWKQIVSAARL